MIPGDFSIPVLVSDTGPNGPGRAISYVEATDVELSELYVELAVFAANVRAEIAEKQHAVNAELLRRMNAAEKRVA